MTNEETSAQAHADSICQDLLGFIDAAPTPYHAVAEAGARLGAAGSAVCPLDADFSALSGGAYHTVVGDGALFATLRPRGKIRSFRIVAAHTDSPNLRLKLAPVYEKAGYLQLGVEVYGGVLLNSWLDRDLQLAGRVFQKGQADGLTTRLVHLSQPLLRVPQLAIHLDREVSEKGLLLNRQEHLVPVLGIGSGQDETARLHSLCANALGCHPQDLVAIELHLADAAKSTRAGLAQEFVFAPRLDNLAMCHAGLTAFLRSLAADEPEGVCRVLCLFDHEEVGSHSDRGANSSVLGSLLARHALGSGCSQEQFHQAMARSRCVSADMAHGVHPNYADRHEPHHRPKLNGGPVLKVNAQQRYATSAQSAAWLTQLAERSGVPLQQYVHRTDLPCGSTIGPALAAQLGVSTVDIGNPMLSMHSAREMAGAHDPAQMVRLLEPFFLS